MVAVSVALEQLFARYSIEAEGYSALVPNGSGRLARVYAVHPKVSLVDLNVGSRKKEPEIVIQLEGRVDRRYALVQGRVSLADATHKVWIGSKPYPTGVYVDFPSEGAMGHIVSPFISALSVSVAGSRQIFNGYSLSMRRYFTVSLIQADLSEVVDVAFRVMRERTAPVL